MNGQEKGAEHFDAFSNWAKGLTLSDARSMVRGGQLNRAELCKEIGCARSVLRQNPRVRQALKELEDDLRGKGVLPQAVQDDAPPLRAKGQLQVATDRERLRHLETENASLRAALTELRKRLQRFEALDAHLAATGRLAR